MAFARKRELNVVDVDLANAVSGVEPMLRHAAGSRVEIEVAAEGACICRLDVSQLEVALINLVVNARDAMPGGGTIRIQVSPSELPGANNIDGAPRHFGRITVTDSGVGMSEDVRKRALEPFFTTKGENGTGLGLSQVYGFVKQVGGEIAIDSAPGEGTAVSLFFPLAGE
jgi:signal transduction histidine kinase